ncbi:MAG: hypothetical protein M0C28_44345 [Candidatus Moduliflexus flocculans]|nr:hypothetical protein [Candidatus Moduliflexus flocculans]
MTNGNETTPSAHLRGTGLPCQLQPPGGDPRAQPVQRGIAPALLYWTDGLIRLPVPSLQPKPARPTDRPARADDPPRHGIDRGDASPACATKRTITSSACRWRSPPDGIRIGSWRRP